MADYVPAPAYPTPNYDQFGRMLAALPTAYRQGQQDNMTLDQMRAFQGGVPMTPQGQPDYAKILATLASKGDIASIPRLGALAQDQQFLNQAGAVSPLLMGADYPAATAAPAGDLPPASAAGVISTRPPRANVSVTDAPNITAGGEMTGVPRQTPNQGAFGNLTGVSTAGANVYGIAEQVIPDPAKRAKAADWAERALGVEPGQKLTPEQAAKAQRYLENYARSSGAGGATAVAGGDRSQPVNLRANNPGNIIDGDFARRQPGYIGHDGRFAKFATPEDGYRAANANLDAYARQGITTPEAILAKWAPRGDGNNDPMAYAATAAKFGVTPGLPVGNDPESRARLLRAMTAVEGGKGAPWSEAEVSAMLTGRGGSQGAPQATQVAQAGGRPIVPQVPLPKGITDPQRAILAIDQEIARLGSNPYATGQIRALTDWRDRIAASTAPMEVRPGQTLVDPRDGSIRFQAPLTNASALAMQRFIEENPTATAAEIQAFQRASQAPRSGIGMYIQRYQEEHPNATSEEVARAVQDYTGGNAGATMLGRRVVGMELAENEAAALIPAVRTASAAISRTQYPTLNKVIMAAQQGTGDENVIRLGIAVESLSQAYARALSPTGTPLAADKAHAHELLEKNWSQGQIEAALDQMQKEIDRAKVSLEKTISDRRNGTTHSEAAPASPAAPAPKTSGPQPGQVEQGYRFKGGDPSKRENWEKV